MMELLRQLLEGYPATPPMVIQTDLSTARAPSYAVTQKGQKLVGEDIAGGSRWRGSYSFTMRQSAVGEADRQRAYRYLNALGDWMQSAKLPEPLTGIDVETPNMQEAYDDGTAVWNMNIHLTWEQRQREEGLKV